MSLYIILSPTVGPQDISDRPEELARIHLDYTDLVQLALAHWNVIGIDDNEILQAGIEAYLQRYSAHRLGNYAHMREVVQLITTSVNRFYDDLRHQLGPIVDQIDVDVKLRLHKHLHKDLVVTVENPHA